MRFQVYLPVVWQNVRSGQFWLWIFQTPSYCKFAVESGWNSKISQIRTKFRFFKNWFFRKKPDFFRKVAKKHKNPLKKSFLHLKPCHNIRLLTTKSDANDRRSRSRRYDPLRLGPKDFRLWSCPVRRLDAWRREAEGRTELSLVLAVLVLFLIHIQMVSHKKTYLYIFVYTILYILYRSI